MIPHEVKTVALAIGQFYLQKNKGDYNATAKEITDIHISKIEVTNKGISITTACPGRLIGSRGLNIDALSKFLKKDIHIVEEMDPLISYLIPNDEY